MMKALNLLENTCLKKLQNPMIQTMTKLEGLMFDSVYADLMVLVSLQMHPYVNQQLVCASTMRSYCIFFEF